MITRVFKSGNSQAVRIPRELQLDTSEVEISRRGDELIIRPMQKNLVKAFYLITEMSDDFMADGRDETMPQERNFDL